MFAFLRRGRERALSSVEFCDSCARVCTAGCRSAALHDRTRTAALTYTLPR